MIEIRPLTTAQELEGCLELQRQCFGFADIDLLPLRFYVVLNSIGGLVLGAFDDGALVGFLNAMPGIRDRMPYWHSQVLAVVKDHWNAGIGSRLKLAQRDYARQQGIGRIEWTFDPLESKNAYLNTEKLGAIVRRFYKDHYGHISSALHSGLDSDRVVAEWWIDQPRIMPEGEIRRLFIPADIQSMKQQRLESARQTQLRVREQFLKNIQDDYFVAGFERTDDWNAYLFLPGASRVYQSN